MSIEFTPRIELIEPELAVAEKLLQEKAELGFDDKFLMGDDRTSYFRADLEVPFPAPDQLSRELTRRNQPGSGEGANTEDKLPGIRTAERRVAEKLRRTITDAQEYGRRVQAAASWMVRAFDQSNRINEILGDVGLYYEYPEDYLRGVGARFCYFDSAPEAQKAASDIVLVSGVQDDAEYEGRLLHVQPLLNIAWILPADRPWSTDNVVSLDMDLGSQGELNVHLQKSATYAQLYRQPELHS